MMNTGPSVEDRSRKYENIVYAVLWLLVLILPFFNEFMRHSSGESFSWCRIFRWWIGLIPFLIVFLINNFVLVTRYLLKNKVGKYLGLFVILIFLFMVLQAVSYEDRMAVYEKMQFHLNDIMPHPRKSVIRFMGMPMPLVMNLALVLLLLAVNTTIIILFRYINEKQARKSLETLRLKDELKFLKAQVNPHFFMNMLNNIHAMIELDPMKAQDMTLELSKMMRYVLYEGDNSTAFFKDELAFISSYVGLMRRRYPQDKVEISLDVPKNPSSDIILPPMLFIAFVENAFKHGISYQTKSRITVSIEEKNGEVTFRCFNTKPSYNIEVQAGGVGLENVRRRLDILYRDSYDLQIKEDNESFNVLLIIPSL